MNMARTICGILALLAFVSTGRAQAPEQTGPGNSSPTAGLTGLPERDDHVLQGEVLHDPDWPVSEIMLWKQLNLDGSVPATRERLDSEPDEQGRYRFEGLTPGIYYLSPLLPLRKQPNEWPWQPAYFTRSVLVDSTTSETEIPLSIPPEGFRLSGRVLNGDTPLNEIRVGVSPMFESEFLTFGDVTDADGRFEVAGLKAGAHQVMFEMQDAETPGRYRTENYAINVNADAEREFQYDVGHELNVRIELPAEYSRDGTFGISSALLSKSDMAPVDVMDEPSTVGFDRNVVQGRLEGLTASFTGRFKGDYFIRLVPSSMDAKELPAQPVNVDNTGADQDVRLEIPRPGNLEIRIDAPEELLKAYPSLSFWLAPDGREVFSISDDIPLHENRCTRELIPAGRYVLQAGQTLGAKMLLPHEQEVIIQPGQTAIVRVKAEPVTRFQADFYGQDLGGSVMGIDMRSNTFVTPSRIRISGPRNFEFFPSPDVMTEGNEPARALAVRPPSGAFYNRVAVFDLPTGEYTLEVDAEGFDPLHESFIIENEGDAVFREYDLHWIGED